MGAAVQNKAAVPTRVCAYRYCNADITHLRRDARFCSPAHRAAEHHELERAGADPGETPTDPYRGVLTKPAGQIRRPSREGLGTRIYLTPREVRALGALLHGIPGLASIHRKLDLASARVGKET